jgi:hypothetical protein
MLKGDRLRFSKWLGVWLAAGAILLVLAILDSGDILSRVLFRVWLLGGAGYGLARSRRFDQLPPEENISTFAALGLIATVGLVGLIIGGSILELVEDDPQRD